VGAGGGRAGVNGGQNGGKKGGGGEGWREGETGGVVGMGRRERGGHGTGGKEVPDWRAVPSVARVVGLWGCGIWWGCGHRKGTEWPQELKNVRAPVVGGGPITMGGGGGDGR